MGLWPEIGNELGPEIGPVEIGKQKKQHKIGNRGEDPILGLFFSYLSGGTYFVSYFRPKAQNRLSSTPSGSQVWYHFASVLLAISGSNCLCILGSPEPIEDLKEMRGRKARLQSRTNRLFLNHAFA